MELRVVFDDLRRDEALRAIWLARLDIRETYFNEGWEPGQWKEATQDWWRYTPEAAASEGDVVAFARHSVGFVPSHEAEQQVAELFSLTVRGSSVAETTMKEHLFLYRYVASSP